MSGTSRHTLRIHLGLLVAEILCVSAFAIEISRALAGNTLSWAYVVEWPVLGLYAVYMWRKLLHDDTRPSPDVPPATPRDDARLSAWNEYLDQVHRDDHPPGPAS